MVLRREVLAVLSFWLFAALVLTAGTAGCSSKSKKSVPAELVVLTESLGNAVIGESYSA